jgi:hypothetical protein
MKEDVLRWRLLLYPTCQLKKNCKNFYQNSLSIGLLKLSKPPVVNFTSSVVGSGLSFQIDNFIIARKWEKNQVGFINFHNTAILEGCNLFSNYNMFNICNDRFHWLRYSNCATFFSISRVKNFKNLDWTTLNNFPISLY